MACRQKKKVLVLDGMWNKSLAAVRSLGRKGFRVTAGERTPLAAALFSKYCSRRFIYPSPIDQKERFLMRLEKELIEGDYEVILPMEWTTQALLTDALYRQRLEQYTKIPFADREMAARINDKAFLMRYCADNGYEVPKTYFTNKLEDLGMLADSIEYPVLIKPRVSSGSRGIACVKVKNELMRSYLKVHSRYPLPIVQELLPQKGEIYGVGLLLNFESEVRASFVYRRIRQYPISGGPSTLRESVKRDDIRHIAEMLMKSIGWKGIAHVEFKIDTRDNRPKLLEINPRFWGSLPLAIQSGIDFPYLLCRMAMDGDIDPVYNYRVGERCRWLLPGDLMHFLKNPERFRLNPNFFDFRIKDDIISLRDPLPTLGRILSVFTLLFDKEMRSLMKR